MREIVSEALITFGVMLLVIAAYLAINNWKARQR